MKAKSKPTMRTYFSALTIDTHKIEKKKVLDHSHFLKYPSHGVHAGTLSHTPGTG